MVYETVVMNVLHTEQFDRNNVLNDKFEINSMQPYQRLLSVALALSLIVRLKTAAVNAYYAHMLIDT